MHKVVMRIVLMIIIGVIICDLKDTRGELIMSVDSGGVYRIRSGRNLSAQAVCERHNESVATLNENLFRLIVNSDKIDNTGLVWIKNFDGACNVQNGVNKSLTSCLSDRKYICEGDSANKTRQPVKWKDVDCNGTELAYRNQSGTFWMKKNSVEVQKGLDCMALDITTKLVQWRRCDSIANTTQVLCHNKMQKRVWIAIIIGVGSFIIGVICSGILFFCIYRRANKKSSERKHRKKKKTRSGLDDGAYAEIIDVDTYDHISRNPLNKKARDFSHYDKPDRIPYTQPLDLISDTKGDYAEPYQHLGKSKTLEIGTRPLSSIKDSLHSLPRGGGRPRGQYKIRAPEVPPPGIPTSRLVQNVSDGGGEYADPMEACHIKPQNDANTAEELLRKEQELDKV